MTLEPQTITDEALMADFQKGSDVAFNTLVSRWQLPLKRFLYRLTRSHTTTEDLIQETFLRVFTKKVLYHTHEKFSTWVYTIAHNLAKNHFRSLLRWNWIQPANPADENWDSTEKSDQTPAQLNEKKEEATKIKIALQKLDSESQSIVILFYYEGLSTSHIAQIVKISAKAVETKLYRARQKLKILLNLKQI